MVCSSSPCQGIRVPFRTGEAVAPEWAPNAAFFRQHAPRHSGTLRYRTGPHGECARTRNTDTASRKAASFGTSIADGHNMQRVYTSERSGSPDCKSSLELIHMGSAGLRRADDTSLSSHLASIQFSSRRLKHFSSPEQRHHGPPAPVAPRDQISRMSRLPDRTIILTFFVV